MPQDRSKYTQLTVITNLPAWFIRLVDTALRTLAVATGHTIVFATISAVDPYAKGADNGTKDLE